LKNLSPIIIVCYNRSEHFKKTINSLANNEDAINSTVYICLDGPRNDHDISEINKIISYAEIKKIFFSNLVIMKSLKHLGLRKNIISSVTKILKKYDKIIVLEDDIFVSKNFLNYMNCSLDFYQKLDKVWHISGFSPINNFQKKDNVYVSNSMFCWGWGTWKNKWEKFFIDEKYLIKVFNSKMINNFNLENSYDSYSQILSNKKKKINTWAVFWYATIFLNNGFCINPYVSLTKNIGLDGSGHNSGLDIELDNFQKINNDSFDFKPELIIEENPNIRKLIKDYHNLKNNTFFNLIEKVLIFFFREKISYKLKFYLNQLKRLIS
jgi:hypothetical protein